MGRKSALTEFEKGNISAFKASGMSNREIAKVLNRSPKVINNFITLGSQYGLKRSSGRLSKLSKRQKRTIIKDAKSNLASLSQISQKPNINVSKTTVHRVVVSNSFLKYKKKKSSPQLKPIHKEKRLKWAKEMMSWKENWKRIVWSDEKKFNLDGPDGWKYYWHDIREHEQIFSKRQQGGGSVMIWACFGWNGKSDIVLIKGRSKALDYQNMLEDHLLTVAEEIGGLHWQFQQDNAPIHTARSTYEWFSSNGVQVMDWPSLSPDLNPLENLWGILSRAVYANGRQYRNIDELKASITENWNMISGDITKNLIRKMPDRVFKVIQKNGGFIGH